MLNEELERLIHSTFNIHNSTFLVLHPSSFLLVPHLRQPSARYARYADGVVRRIVEEGETGVGDVFEVEDVQRAGALVEAVAVFAGVEAQHRAKDQANGGLVRDDDEAL